MSSSKMANPKTSKAMEHLGNFHRSFVPIIRKKQQGIWYTPNFYPILLTTFYAEHSLHPKMWQCQMPSDLRKKNIEVSKSNLLYCSKGTYNQNNHTTTTKPHFQPQNPPQPRQHRHPQPQPQAARGKPQATSHKQPATSNQQQTTINQQQPTNNKQKTNKTVTTSSKYQTAVDKPKPAVN